MFTLKNIFWMTLVILNLTFIAVVSYTRLKPPTEVVAQSPEKIPANGKQSNDSANWRFASADSRDLSKIREPGHSSENAMRLISTSDQTAKPITNRKADAILSERTPLSSNATTPTVPSKTIEVSAAANAYSLNSEDTQTTDNKPTPVKHSLEESYKVDTYYDGNLVRAEETDNDGNLQVTIKETMNTDDLGKLPAQDTRYVEALEQLSSNTEEAPANNINEQTATSTVAKSNTAEQSVDYFNKVDVSVKNKVPQRDNNMTLAKQIENAVSGMDASSPNRKNSTADKADDLFFQALETESKERANEMRTIKIARGDTLWDIAQRAYGNGFKYEKIFEANPYLSSPDKIKIGDTLRVPI
jgi:nucleoid-associated protein YgaU